jgi:tetratricopeptide (TPR) repeat protein
MEFLAAKCPSCGADIHVPGNKDFAFCTFCGSNVKVRESVIMKSDVDTDNLIALGNVELQARDYNEAMDYFTRVLEVDGKNPKAWLGRGHATIRKANSQIKLFEEAMVYFTNALDNSHETEIEALTDIIIAEYTPKKFMTGHIEFLDKLIKMKPEKTFLLQVISLLDVVEADMSKSGNKLSPQRQTIKTDALSLLKENHPVEYNRYLRSIEKKEKHQDEKAANYESLALERKERELFSGKRIAGDIFTTSLLNLFISLIIIIIFDSLDITEGFIRFAIIFLVLSGFAQLAVYVNKKRQMKAFKEELMLKKNPFRNMVQ